VGQLIAPLALASATTTGGHDPRREQVAHHAREGTTLRSPSAHRCRGSRTPPDLQETPEAGRPAGASAPPRAHQPAFPRAVAPLAPGRSNAGGGTRRPRRAPGRAVGRPCGNAPSGVAATTSRCYRTTSRRSPDAPDGPEATFPASAGWPPTQPVRVSRRSRGTPAGVESGRNYGSSAAEPVDRIFLGPLRGSTTPRRARPRRKQLSWVRARHVAFEPAQRALAASDG